MRCRSLLVAGAGLVCFALASLPAKASDDHHYSRWPKIRLAGVAVGVGYTHFGGFPLYGGYPFGYGGFGLYDAGLYGPWGWGGGSYWGAVPPAAFYDASLGRLKLKELDPAAAVFVDGGYAGTAGKLKDMWIEPGTHQLRITEGGHTYEEKIYVLTGKTMTINPETITSQGGQVQ